MKRLIIFIFLVYCTFNIYPCYSQWYQISLPVSGSVYQMQFINHNTGWASIYHGYDDFYLLKTTDTGTNWNIIFHDSAKVQNFQFINDTLGYARGVGHLTHYMLKTTDGGFNWTIMQDSPGYVFSGFYMVGADTGYVDVWYFNPPYSNEFTFRTVNGFQTLETVSTGTGGVPSTMYFLKEKYNGEYCGFILAGGILSKTTNSGYNWQTINFIEAGEVNSSSFINKDTGWVVYNPNIGNNSKILYTSNGGLNWIQQYYSSIQFDFGYIQAVSKNKVWCGKGAYSRILVSLDGGNNWGYQTSPINVNSKIYFYDSLLGFAWSTQIVRTTNGGGQILQIANSKEQITNNFILYQNYPNPFNSVSSIKYKVKRSAYIKIVIYNINGKEIAALINGKKTLGDYEVIFSGDNLSSGTYFYSLFINEQRIDTKKLMLIK